MKASELMIEDWVLHDREPYQIRQLGIYGVDRDGEDYPAVCIGKPNGVGLIVERNEIEPIPLTQEILEKNGFKDVGDNIYQLEEKPCWFWVDFFNHWYGCEYDTSTYEYEDHGHRLKLYGIPSVNELQHSFRLVGIKKEIVI